MFFATLGFAVYLKVTFPRISQLGSLVNQMDADNEMGYVDKVPTHFINEYQQPALRNLEPWDGEDMTGLPAEMAEKSAGADGDKLAGLEEGTEREVGFSD